MRAVRIANDGQRGSSYNPDAALRPGAATCSAGRPEAHARANHMGTRRRARGLPVASAPAWLYGAAACVLIYFALIAVSDLRGREASGALVKFGDRQGTVVGVIPGSPAERAGVQPGDRVISVAGRPVTSRLDWTGVEANLAVGARFTTEVERNGLPLRLDAPEGFASLWQPRTSRTIALWVSRLIQLACLAIAAIVAFRKPHDRLARLAAWMLASLGVYTVILPAGLAVHWRLLPPPVSWLVWLPFASGMGLALVFFVFCSEFPQPLLRRRVLLLACLPGGVGVAWLLAFGMFVVHGEARTSIGIDRTPLLVGMWTVYFAGGLTLLWMQYQRLADGLERRRMRLLLAGAAIGCTAGTFVAIEFWIVSPPQLTRSLFNSPATMAGMLLVLTFPLAVAYVVSRHRVFDLTFIVRRGVQYALARRLLVSLVPALVAASAIDLVVRHESSLADIVRTRGMAYAGMALVLAVSLAFRKHWLESLDRRFFRERYHSEQVLRNVAAKLRRASDPASALSGVVSEIALALRPTFVAALGVADGSQHLVPMAATPSLPATLRLGADSTLIRLARLMPAPLELSPDHDSWIAEHLPPAEAATVVDAELELLVPVTVEEGREVVLALGPRRSEEPYAQIDIDLLEAIAGSLGLVLDRALPQQAAAKIDEDEDVYVSECPSCATCFDTSLARCPRDGTLLIATELPPVLAGRYRLESRIGAGGMGTVYAARDQELDRPVAVKVIGEAMAGSRDAAQRFRHEAQTAASFTHPNVVTVHDVGITGAGRPFLVMERLEGRTLRAELDASGPLPSSRVLRIVGDICRVLDEAHARGFVHRDLKPENVFIAHATGVELTKVLDFGIATVFASEAGTVTTRLRSGAVMGSLPYMSPEQLRGAPASRQWDLWALGVMAIEMLTGARPSTPGRRHEPALRSPDEAERLAAFCAVALADDVAVRPRTAAEFLDCLGMALRATSH